MTKPFAVVTGAASGIGLALTRELVARNFDVIAIDKDPLPFEPAANITCARIDIRDTDALQQLADAHSGRKLDILFANAGIAAPGSVFGSTPQTWQRAWEINTMAPLNTLRCWWSHLQAARGKAVVTASAAAMLTYPGAPLYRSTKAALLSLLEGLYYETRDSGVSLHVLCPGMVQSNIVANAMKEMGLSQPDPISQYLAEAMHAAEPAEHFARRILDGLAQPEPAPFYWLTHDKTVAALDKRHRAVTVDGRPPLSFEDMP